MRILGVGTYNELGFLYLRLMAEGHEVRVFIEDEGAHDVLAGMVTRIDDWRAELPWIREAGEAGLLLFEDIGNGELQDQLRRDGYNVLGGSAIGDRLESEREVAQQCFRDVGLSTAPTTAFDNLDTARQFIAEHPKRYVLKFDGSDFPSDMNFVGAREDGQDVAAMLRRHAKTWDEDYDDSPRFILMDFVRGVETGVGAFFNGTEFTGPINIDWEHKRLFPQDLGELTGEMGTVVSYRGAEKIFEATLGRLAPMLREGRHVGYVNMNTIIDERGIWPLELTCRFGYPGFAILSALHDEPLGPVLGNIARGVPAPMKTHPGFAVGVVLTVPPFPHHHGYDELGKGLPILIPHELSSGEREHLHFGEVGLVDGELVTTGIVGYTMVVTGRGDSIEEAQRAAYALAATIAIPNVRYRTDIGDRLRANGYAALASWGWFSPTPSTER